MIKRLFAVALAVGLLGTFVGGCKSEPKKVWLEDLQPPVFGSANVKDWPKFLEGRWGLKQVLDMNLAKQLGTETLAEQNNAMPIEDMYKFKADGTFQLKFKNFGMVVAGTWQANDKTLQLTYLTFDGKPIDQEMAEAKKDEEHGGSVGIMRSQKYEDVKGTLDKYMTWQLSADGKSLTLPVAPGELQALSASGNTLVRMVAEAENQE